METYQKTDTDPRPINIKQSSSGRSPAAGYVLAALVVLLGFFLVLFFNWQEETNAPVMPRTSTSPAAPAPSPAVPPAPRTESEIPSDTTGMRSPGGMDATSPEEDAAPSREINPEGYNPETD